MILTHTRGEESRELEPAVDVRRAHHGDLDVLVAQAMLPVDLAGYHGTMKAYSRWTTLLPWLFLPTACAPHTSSGTVSPLAGDLPEVVVRRCGRQPGDFAFEHASMATTPIPGLDPGAPIGRITPENGLRAVCMRGNLRYATDLVPRVGWSKNLRCVDDMGTTLAAFRAVVRAGDPAFCREPNP